MKLIIFLLIIVIALGFLNFFVYKLGNISGNISANSLDKYATGIVKKCSSASYKPTCYEKEVPMLMDSISMEEAFQVTRIIQDLDKSYQYCHVLGHELSARETAKDPGKWKDIIPRCPSGLCSNGCIHGAFQERFRAESLPGDEIERIKPELKHICEPRENWDPTGLESGTCYHALGHLLMYITDADIYNSSKICEDVALDMNGRNWSPLCYDGVFMQLFQPLEPDDFALIAGKEIKKNELSSFCSKFTGEKRNSCWSEGWPLYRDDIMKPEGLVEFCSGKFVTDINDQRSCYLDLFYVLAAQFQFNIFRMRDFCEGLPNPWKNQCFANFASRMIETDYRNIPTVIKWCSEVLSEDGKDTCFRELIFYSTYNFHAGSPEYSQLCNGLPEPWKKQCL